MRLRKDQGAYAIGGGGILLFFLVHAYRVYGTDVALVDDAFIFFRYARHWAQGYGLVWNIGEAPVEGISSHLYTALLATGIRLGVPVVMWATLLNLVLALGVLVLTDMYARVLSTRMPPSFRNLGLIAALLLAAAPPFAFWTDAGMDTMLFTFMLLLSAFLALHAHARARHCLSLGVALALLGTTRLDAVPLAVYILLALIVRPTEKRASLSCVKRATLAFGVPFFLFFLARWLYFGWPLPNTFYAKMGGGVTAWEEGIKYILDFLRAPGVIPLGVLALIAVLIRANWENVYTGGIILLLLARAIASGGDWMPHFRLMVPLLPFLSLLAAAGIYALAAILTARRNHQRGLRLFLTGIVALSLFWPSLRVIQHTPWRLWRPARLVEPMHASQYAMGTALRPYLCPDDTVALIAAGAAAYINDDHRIIDMLGLSDVHTAHTPPVLYKGRWDSGHVRLDVDYLVAQAPEWIQLDTHLYDSPTFQLRDWMPPQRLWNDARIRAMYDLFPLRVQVPTDYAHPRVGTIFFLHRKDAPLCGPSPSPKD